jgi:hypothetical protein
MVVLIRHLPNTQYDEFSRIKSKSTKEKYNSGTLIYTYESKAQRIKLKTQLIIEQVMNEKKFIFMDVPLK